MKSWTQQLLRAHQVTHPNDGWNLVLGGGASEDEISALEGSLGITFPREFRELYLTHNGVGMSRERSEEIVWQAIPLALIPAAIKHARDWFHETHPEVSARFFPFLDWYCGDYDGYLLGEGPFVLPGIYSFEHESYEFDADQDSEEFLLPAYSSLREHDLLSA
jgi:hypothetical protein